MLLMVVKSLQDSDFENEIPNIERAVVAYRSREQALLDALRKAKAALAKMDKYGFNELDEIEEITRLTRLALTAISAIEKQEENK